MKLSIKKKDVIDVMAKVQGLTNRKSSLAITSNVLITASDNGIVIAATDLETGFEGHYPADVKEEGVIAINSRKLFEIIRDFPVEDINITEIDDYWIEIGNKQVEYHIAGMNADDFPNIPKIENVDYFEADSSCVKKMIEKSVIVSGPADDQRAHITGVLFDFVKVNSDHFLRMVSTDGSRLTKVDCLSASEVVLPGEQKILIPKKGLIEVNKFLESTGVIEMGFKENHFIVKREGETLLIRLLEGDFPDYKGIIARGEGCDISMSNPLFSMMLKRMSILSSDKYHMVIFNFEKDKLVISSANPEIGESKEDMAIDYEGKKIEVAFNPRYFIDALNAIDDDTVIMNIEGEEKPCLLDGEKDKNYICVISPMRI